MNCFVVTRLAESCKDFLHFLFHLFEECDDFAEGGRVFLFQFLHPFAEHDGTAQVFKKMLAVQLLFGLRFNYILFHVVFVLCSQPFATGSVGLIFTFYLHCDFDLVTTGEVAMMVHFGKKGFTEHLLRVVVAYCALLELISSERATIIKVFEVIL